MQDQYVGDIGDFGKYGLLRHLTGMRSDAAPEDALRLGVVWYLFPDGGNNDGTFTDYLCNPKPRDSKLRDCDPELYWSLRRLVRECNRNIFSVRMSGILPRDTAYHGQSLSYPDGESQSSKKLRREAWIKGALEATKEASLVFVDPDNGITEKPIQLRKNGPKYVFMDDLNRFYKRGQNLVIYHLIARWDNADNQIRYFAERLKDCLNLPRLPWALRYRRGTTRAYFIVPHKDHGAALESRLKSFLDRPWCKQGHFERVT